MALTLYFHPLSSFCQKTLIALYENGTPFTPHIVDFGDPAASAAFKAIWPIGRFPVLRDGDPTIPESSVIIEYLDRHFPGPTKFIPADPERALETRLRDRLFDLYVNVPMQKVVTDRLRPAGTNDGHGVADAKALLRTSLTVVDKLMATRQWAIGDAFTMADCAAAPALFYADMIVPLADEFKHAAAYLQRLKARPSYARVLQEAEPYFKLIPKAS